MDNTMNKFFLITLIISFCLLALDSQAQSFEELIKQGDDYTVQGNSS